MLPAGTGKVQGQAAMAKSVRAVMEQGCARRPKMQAWLRGHHNMVVIERTDKITLSLDDLIIIRFRQLSTKGSFFHGPGGDKSADCLYDAAGYRAGCRRLCITPVLWSAVGRRLSHPGEAQPR